MNDFLYFCPSCKTIYEIIRHHIRPPAEPVCEGCQQELPLTDDGDWLNPAAIGAGGIARSGVIPTFMHNQDGEMVSEKRSCIDAKSGVHNQGRTVVGGQFYDHC